MNITPQMISHMNQLVRDPNSLVSNFARLGNPTYQPYESSNIPQPYGNAYRGIGSDWFNAENIAREDWMRAEQSNMLEREFNAAEAQKNRDFQERMSRNAYTYAVEDMKRAGINPILQYANHSMSLPQGSNAYSSNSQSNYRGKAANTGEFLSFLSSLASIGAGLYTHGAFGPKSGKIGF